MRAPLSAVLGDELELSLDLGDEVQRFATVVGDLDHLVLAVLSDDCSDCVGGPGAGPFDLVEGFGERDDIVLVNGLLGGGQGTDIARGGTSTGQGIAEVTVVCTRSKASRAGGLERPGAP